jgi:hypothetical protein
MSSGPGVAASLFVGRERELAGLVAILEAAAEGQGGLAVLVGEPGIGKSRLAEEVAARGAALGFRVGRGRAWESGAPAYDLWARALAAAGAPAPDASVATALEGEAARFQLFRRVADGLQAAAQKVPVLLTLDDVHAADLSSLRLLEFVARELRGVRVVVIATRRDLDPTLTPEVEATLARAAREGRVFVLGRLPRPDVERLIRADSPALVPGLESAVWEATQGNPLFATEMVRLLQEDPERARGGDVPIPYSVHDIVRRRLAGVEGAGSPQAGPSVRQVLEVASVLGPEVTEAGLALVLGQPIAALAGGIELAMRSGLLVRRGGERLAFPHALMRDAIRRDIPAPRRADLHRAAAAALERLDAGGAAVEIAHHALAAGAGADLAARVARAVDGLVAAFADDDAALLLQRATGVLEAVGDARGAAELRVLLGEILTRRGDLTGGQAACARAAVQARAEGDVVLLARAALARAAAGAQGETDRGAHALLEEALAALARPGPELAGVASLRVRVQARLAGSLQPAPDPAAAARAALEAVHAARALGEDRTLLDVLHSAGAAFGEAVFVPELVDLWREAVRLAERLGDRAKLLRARLRLVFALVETGDVAAADAQIDAFETDARATGQPRHRWPAPLLRAMRALQEGRFDAAEALADEAADLVAQSRDPVARGALLAHRFARLRVLARGPELLAIEPEFLSVVGRWNDAAAYTDCMIALIRSNAGDLETARRHLARVPPDSTPARIRASMAGLALIAVRVGDRAWAARLYQPLLPDATRWYTVMLSGFCAEATYARILGGLAAVLGRDAEADAHYASALARAEEVGAAPEQARILAAHAALLAARPSSADRARGAAMAARARALAAPLGLGDVIAATGPEPAAPAPAAPEIRVAAAPLTLVAEGETWLLRAGSTSLRLKDGRGVRYVARLLGEPDREIHALDLAGAGNEADAGDAGEPLDAAAVAAYRRRLAELEDELREAEGWNDGARATRLRAEMEFLSAELSRAIGLGGRSRRVGSAAERARVAVTRRIRDLIRRVAEQSPELGRHLEATVKTGTTCSYRPL